MKDAIQWINKPIYSNARIVLGTDEINIKALVLFGHHYQKMENPPLEPHYHSNCIEFVYLVSGMLTFNIEGNIFNLYPGDLLITPANLIHNSVGESLAMHSMYWFQLDIHDAKNFLNLEENKAKELINDLNKIEASIISLVPEQYDKYFECIFTNLCTPNKLPKDGSCFLLLYVLNQIILQSKKDSYYDYQTRDILKIIHFIDNNIKEELPLEDLANLAKLSVSRFKKKFSSQIGMAPRTYINYQKVNAAKKYLLEGHGVTKTAMEYSFSSSNYFAVVFKRYLGKSPSQYVKKHISKID